MATFNVTRTKHATLVASTVDTVNLTGTYSRVRVMNRSTFAIFMRFDGINPVVQADETYALQAGLEREYTVPDINAIQVKLISGGAAAYSVEAI